MCDHLFKKVHQLLESLFSSGKVNKEHIDQVIVVGGASRMPKVQAILKEYLSVKTLNMQINADQATVEGAAMSAALKFNKKGQKASEKLRNFSANELSSLFLAT